jgi:hypothetical protein
MKASELVGHLQAMIQKYGDLPVAQWDPEWGIEWEITIPPEYRKKENDNATVPGEVKPPFFRV